MHFQALARDRGGRRSSHAMPLGAMALSLLVAACGGGSANEEVLKPEDEPQAVIVQVDLHLVGAGWSGDLNACIDLDRDWQCGPGEPRAPLAADFSFTFELAANVDLATSTVLLPVRAQDVDGNGNVVAPGYLLAASARPHTALNVLTTLDVVRKQFFPDGGDLSGYLKLAPKIEVHSVGDVEADRINALARTAFMAALPLATSGAQETSPLSATFAAAVAVTDVLHAYMDSETGTLLPTVNARVVVGEAVQRLQPLRCEIPAVASISIETEDHAPIESKETYLRATIRIDDPDGEVQTMPARVRGRGNSTWLMAKKPYRISLDQAASVLGMPADRDWVLLANYADKSLVRNAVAFCLGEMLGLGDTPRYRYAELSLNGEYQGLYQVVEQIKVANHRVAIGPLTDKDDDPGMGFLLEIDGQLDEDVWFISMYGIPYTLKSSIQGGQLHNIVSFIADMENAFRRTFARDRDQGYLKYLEADTLIDVYLVNEFLRNNDGFQSSTYVHRVRDARLRFGPLWDFDIAAGNVNYNGNDAPEGWWTRQHSAYMGKLLEDSAFAQHLRARWEFLSARLPQLLAFIDGVAHALEHAQTRNFQRWPILDIWVWPNAVVTGSYSGEVAYLRDWLSTRAAWMDGQILGAP